MGARLASIGAARPFRFRDPMTGTFVVGTAGHIDHGKSSLVRALTGTDPDRLAEEKLRQMTIDLGFAEFVTLGGNRVHIVDVPGHERFVRNMLAGAAGVDAAMLVIAADDGPMPQTREHLAILDLLGIERGVVALSKADLVDDEWLAYVAESIRDVLAATSLAKCEIVPVSSTTLFGLGELQAALDRALESVHRVDSVRPPRLPVDRVFSMPGFGTIVTGTLSGKELRVGDRVEIYPGGRSARVRGLQTFGASVPEAGAGSRVAVNLVGIDSDELGRGDVLSLPGALTPVMRFDARMRLLRSSDRPLRQNDEVIVFAGSAEAPARAALLEGDELEAGRTGWVQFRLGRPMTLMAGDRFVLRRPSPAETIGGGTVIDLDPPRHKRNQQAVVVRLEELAAGDPAERLLAWIGDRFSNESELEKGPLGVDGSHQAVLSLLAAGRLRRIGSMFAPPSTVDKAVASLLILVDEFHAGHPLEVGVTREELRMAMQLSRPVLDALLVESAVLVSDGRFVRCADFRIELSPEHQRRADDFLGMLRAAAFQPPTVEDAGIEPALLRAMISLGSIIEVGEGIVFLPDRLNEARAALMQELAERQSITLAEYRDRLGTTRRYAQALLEYFDRQRVTRRIGDQRVAIRPFEQKKDVAS